eukprot:g15834.t1
MSHEPEEEEEEKSPEEVQLEAEIRAIELDISLMDLRRELEERRSIPPSQAQEELLERWEEGIRKLKEEKEEAERYHLNTDQDRADERALKAEFRQAQQSVALLRERVQRLEALRAQA